MKINGEVPTGAVIAITPSNSWDLAVDGGEEASALHVTLKFLGKAIDFDRPQRAVIEHLMRRFVAGRKSFDVLVTGVERFGENGDAIALTLESPEAVVLHEDAHTITPLIPLKWPEYRPHMTMMYDPSGKKPIPEQLTALVGSTIKFDTILIAFGTDREYIYLDSDDMVMKKKGNGRDYTIPSPLSSPKEIVGSHNHRPAGTSIRWPAMYRELRKKGYSKRKAATISNGKWRRKHGMGPATARGAVELAKTSTNENGGERRLPAMLSPDDFFFAQTEILKAGTSAGAKKGWITRRRGGRASNAVTGVLGSFGIQSMPIKRLDAKRQPKRSKKLHTKMQAERRKSKVNAYILDAMEWDAYGNGVSMDDYINSTGSYGFSDTFTDVIGDGTPDYTKYIRGDDQLHAKWNSFLRKKVMPLVKRLQWADPNADDRDMLDPYVQKEAAMLNTDDFPFAQSEILKAGTRADRHKALARNLRAQQQRKRQAPAGMKRKSDDVDIESQPAFQAIDNEKFAKNLVSRRLISAKKLTPEQVEIEYKQGLYTDDQRKALLAELDRRKKASAQYGAELDASRARTDKMNASGDPKAQKKRRDAYAARRQASRDAGLG